MAPRICIVLPNISFHPESAVQRRPELSHHTRLQAGRRNCCSAPAGITTASILWQAAAETPPKNDDSRFENAGRALQGPFWVMDFFSLATQNKELSARPVALGLSLALA